MELIVFYTNIDSCRYTYARCMVTGVREVVFWLVCFACDLFACLLFFLVFVGASLCVCV